MARTLLSILGSLLVVAGIVLMVTPIPGSSMALASGVALLICSSDRAAACLRFFRARSDTFNRGFEWLEGKTGKMIGDALRRSSP